MARSKSQTRSKSRTRKSISKSPGRTRKMATPKSEPKKAPRSASRSRGRPSKSDDLKKTPAKAAAVKTPKTAGKTPAKVSAAKTPAKSAQKTPTTIPKISRSSSRSASRSRVPKTPAATPASSLIERPSRSVAKKFVETPAVKKVVTTLYRSPAPKKLTYGQAARYHAQNAVNCVSQKTRAVLRYINDNKVDLLVTLLMIFIIAGLFYFFWINDKNVEPLYKMARNTYEEYTKYAMKKYKEVFPQ